MRMGALFTLAASAILILPTAARAIRLTETWSRSFPVGEKPRFELQNVNGNVTVDVWDARSIDVTAEIMVKAPAKAMARELYEGIDIASESDSARVTISTRLPRVREVAFLGPFTGDRPSIRVRYHVTVPRGTSISVRTVNGNITLDLPADMSAAAAADAAHGHVVRRRG